MAALWAESEGAADDLGRRITTVKGTAMHDWGSSQEWKPYTSSGTLRGGTVSRKQDRTVNLGWSHEYVKLMQQGSPDRPDSPLVPHSSQGGFIRIQTRSWCFPIQQPWRCFTHSELNPNSSSFMWVGPCLRASPISSLTSSLLTTL